MCGLLLLLLYIFLMPLLGSWQHDYYNYVPLTRDHGVGGGTSDSPNIFKIIKSW